MALGKLTRSGSFAALAAGLALLALPASVQAQERGHGRWGGGGGGGAAQGGGGGAAQGSGDGTVQGGGWRGGGNGGGWRGRGEAGGGWQGGGSVRSQPAPQGQVQQPERNWSRGDGNGGSRWGGWRGRDGGQAQAPVQAVPQAYTQRRAWSGGSEWRGRNPSGTNDWQARNRDSNRYVGRRDDGARWRNDNNDAWRGGNNAWRGDNGWRGDRQGYARNSQTWRRDWRNDGRYDWRGYRSAHRDVYRLSPYYAPYGGYSYRRLGVGIYLDSLFFGSRYWIDDPWAYRLPPADGPYRWVRYYDDALLVDTYTGEVIDVLYDFFW